ncbi:MAG: site-2 protease family protein [Kofleriaceae bacterium]
MYGHRSTRVLSIGGLSVHTNLEATAIILSTAFLGDTLLHGALIVFCFAFGTGLHLASHLAVAVAFGKGIDRMVLTRAGRIDYSGAAPTFVEGIVRTAAGPTMNAACTLGGYAVLANVDTTAWPPIVLLAVATFTYCSLVLTIINFLPAVPLDGGLILRRILERIVGTANATKAAIVVSALVMLAMAIAGIVWLQPVLVYLAVVITYDNWRDRLRATNLPATSDSGF